MSVHERGERERDAKISDLDTLVSESFPPALSFPSHQTKKRKEDRYWTSAQFERREMMKWKGKEHHQWLEKKSTKWEEVSGSFSSGGL